jgi:tripartite-type tricarboxylate transporter receptor subunit TctC
MAVTALCPPALAVDSVKMMIAAEPGNGCDLVGRELGKAMTATGAAKNVQYQNQAGAGGTIALAQFVNASKGDPAALLVGGSAMMAAIIRNKSAVDLASVTPVARLAAPLKDEGANVGLDAWCGAFAAPGIASAQRDDLVKAAETATKSAEWQASLKANAWESRWLAGEAYASFIAAEGKRISTLLAR